MRKISLKKLVAISAILLAFVSCKKDNNNASSKSGQYGSGVFISCEGQFQTGTGTISFLDRNDNTIQNDIFQAVNKRPLGNVVQSISVFNGYAYIVVNNAGKTEVADAQTFLSVGIIKGLTSPRYFLGITPSKGYISDWSNNIDVINLSNFSMIKAIPAGNGPEEMLLYNDKVYVINSGGWSSDSTLTIIDSKNDALLKNVKIFPVPTGICIDKNNKLWILCSGKGYNGYPAATDSKGHLIRVNPDDYSIEVNLVFPSSSLHPQKLVINFTNDVLYYNYPDGIYQFSITSDSLSSKPLVKLNKIYYGLGFDNKINMLYGTDPVDYVQNGWLFRFNANTGAKVDSFRTGVIPCNFYFN